VGWAGEEAGIKGRIALPPYSHIVLLGFAITEVTTEAAMTFRATARAFVAAATLLMAASAANAFTIEDQGGASGGRGYVDLDKPAAAPDRLTPVSPFNTENGQTTIKQGNSTFQFGGQRSFNERYNTNNLFDPYAREGR
jgi:hypothetical protein